MADSLGNEVPLRARFVKGRLEPEHPENCEPHTPEPEGYMAWWDWQDRMAKTHKQRQCRGCGLWAIWEPKAQASPGGRAVTP